MNKYAFLIAVLSLFAGRHVLAQSTPDKEETKKGTQETVTESGEADEKPARNIKVVPSARSNSKPARVGSAKSRTARPGGNRPARNPRPSSRPVRPGNGRN